MMEKKLKYHQIKVIEHKNYLLNRIGGKRLTLISTLLPAFIMGWKVARRKRRGHVIQRLIKFGLLTAFTHLRKKVS